MNVLVLLGGALKRSGPLFVVWVGLCFVTVLVLRAAWAVELDGESRAGMAVLWGLLLLAGRGLVGLVRRRRPDATGAGATTPDAKVAP